MEIPDKKLRAIAVAVIEAYDADAWKWLDSDGSLPDGEEGEVILRVAKNASEEPSA